MHLFTLHSYDTFIWCCAIANGKITSLFCLFIFPVFTQIIKQKVINTAISAFRGTAIFSYSIFLWGIFIKSQFLCTCGKNAKHKPFWIMFSKPFCHLCCSHLLGFQFVFLKCHVPNWIPSVLLLKPEHCWAEQKDYCAGLRQTVIVNVIMCSICPFLCKHLRCELQAVHDLTSNNCLGRSVPWPTFLINTGFGFSSHWHCCNLLDCKKNIYFKEYI